MTAPKIYTAINAITAELARHGIAKTRINASEQYAYRSIDDICIRLAPLLAKHRVCFLPRVLERASEERSAPDGTTLIRVALRVAFDLVSARDASLHSIETYGEALDAGDRASAKAMTAAYKQAVLQAFCIPIEGTEEANGGARRATEGTDMVADPDQGWEQWARDIESLVSVCETIEALDRVQATYRGQLRAASKRMPEIYTEIGAVMQARRGILARPSNVPLKKSLRLTNAGAHPHETANA
jgi:hypothetical protein